MKQNSQDFSKAICFRLRRIRKNYGISQKDAASYVNRSQSQFSKMERGVQPFPLQDIIILCDRYNVTLNNIISCDDCDPKGKRLF